jgi:hydrogenase-4 membrane subunit HyfE
MGNKVPQANMQAGVRETVAIAAAASTTCCVLCCAVLCCAVVARVYGYTIKRNSLALAISFLQMPLGSYS